LPPQCRQLAEQTLPQRAAPGYFVDGVTESLTTDLSRIKDAFVIARNTASAFRRKVIDVKRLGREWNVRYVLKAQCSVLPTASA